MYTGELLNIHQSISWQEQIKARKQFAGFVNSEKYGLKSSIEEFVKATSDICNKFNTGTPPTPLVSGVNAPLIQNNGDAANAVTNLSDMLRNMKSSDNPKAIANDKLLADQKKRSREYNNGGIASKRVKPVTGAEAKPICCYWIGGSRAWEDFGKDVAGDPFTTQLLEDE